MVDITVYHEWDHLDHQGNQDQKVDKTTDNDLGVMTDYMAQTTTIWLE